MSDSSKIAEINAIGNDQFARMPEVAEFSLTSTTVTDGEEFPAAQYGAGSAKDGGADVSPQLSWSGAPEGTKSYALTVFDPDAPTGSGFWHWSVADIPASVTEIVEGAGTPESGKLPEGSFQLKNDGGVFGFNGASPPAGHGAHRYIITVHALDVESLGIDESATNAFFGFNRFFHTLGRASITVWGETPA